MTPELENLARLGATLRQELKKVIIGQDGIIEDVLIALLAGGHVLIEGVPGLGKTLLVETLAKTISGDFQRIQFTPDLLPADVTGSMIFNPAENDFKLRRGPVFTHFLLADEINRAPAKTQAALLEVMQEKQVTIEGTTLPLTPPFMVLATQNPYEQEGTYFLPEAQLDRFLLSVRIDYPSEADEKALLGKLMTFNVPLSNNTDEVRPIIKAQTLPKLQAFLNTVTVDERIVDYALAMVRKTRDMPMIENGAGPRAGIALLVCARAKAVLNQRDYVLPEDVKALAPAVLRHRIQRSPEAEMDGITVERLIEQLVDTIVAVPRQ